LRTSPAFEPAKTFRYVLYAVDFPAEGGAGTVGSLCPRLSPELRAGSGRGAAAFFCGRNSLSSVSLSALGASRDLRVGCFVRLGADADVGVS
jgi:hypothetical protein